MCKYFSAGVSTLLSFILLLLQAFQPCTAGIRIQDTLQTQTTDTVRNQVSDTGFRSDTSALQVSDTLNGSSEEQAEVPLPDSVIYKRTDFSHEELVRGERLFYGLAYLEENSVNCVICHNTSISDTLNWNPDAYEISKKYLNKSALDLSEVLLRPVGKKMMEVHKDFRLTAEDVTLMKAFMDKFAAKGMQQPKPIITKLLLLIIASVLFLISFTDLIIKKIIKNKYIKLFILTVTGVVIIWILAIDAIAIGRSKGYSPDQPIKFSHAVHAGQNQTDCLYCHYTAKTGKTAGIPSSGTCNNCHLLVRSGTRSGLTEIAKVIEALDSNKAVEWVRLYKLPDYVYFNHATHVNVGEIDCEKCHGDVKTVDRLFQFTDLSMGWCIKCHETTKINLSNEYYQTYYPEQAKLFHEGRIDSVMFADINGKDCGKCHY